LALFLTLTATLLADNRLFAADQTAPAAAKPTVFQLPAIRDVYNPPRTPSSIAVAKPSPQKPAAAMEKLKDLGAQLRRALDVAFDLLSGNETDLLSRNKTALLSGNKPEILSGNEAELLTKNKTALLSGNKPEILSGNKPAILSGNTTPILSGNTFSMFSNIKIEVHVYNSGNNVAAPPSAQPPVNPANVSRLRGGFLPLVQPLAQPPVNPPTTPSPAR